MKKLRERLKRLEAAHNTLPTQISRPEQEIFVPDQEQESENGQKIEEIVDGEMIAHEFGQCFVYEEKYQYHPLWREALLNDWLKYSGKVFGILAFDSDFADIPSEKIAFIDTETTGLAGGSGTYVFLVGVGYWHKGIFTIRQYFMPDPHQEKTLLTLLGNFLADFQAVVSFNGKTFDLPLINSRFTLQHKEPLPLSQGPHLDLLRPARKFWRKRLKSCALKNLEENLLGFTREGDVPGWLIPTLYFQYVKNKCAAPIKVIFHHNALDILSMVTLSNIMAEILSNIREIEIKHGEDWHALGRFYQDREENDQAIFAYRKTIATPCSTTVLKQTMYFLSFLYKRLEQWPQALEIWHSLLGTDLLYPYEELAKYYEHKEHDYPTALKLVRTAIDLIKKQELKSENQSETLSQLRHRLARLEHKESQI